MLRGISTPMSDKHDLIRNGNRTEWSPIRSVIIRVINKILRPRSGSPICLITSMITDRIGRHEVLLPINHKYNKIREKKLDKAKPTKDLSSLMKAKKPFLKLTTRNQIKSARMRTTRTLLLDTLLLDTLLLDTLLLDTLLLDTLTARAPIW